MRRLAVVALATAFLLSGLIEAKAAWFGSKKKATTDQAVQTQAAGQVAQKEQAVKKEPAKMSDRAKEESEKARKALMERRLNELDNTEWQIELTPLSGKGKKESDAILFKNKQVSIFNFSKKGFPSTNFTLTVQPDGNIVWETMQTSDKSGIAFWRGEMDATMQKMSGILSHQIDDKTKQDFSFVSIGKKSVPVSGN